MLKRLIVLAVVLEIGYAGWHVGVVWLRYQQFQDTVRDAALFGTRTSDDALRDRVVELAQRYTIAVDRDSVEITRGGTDRVTITVTYVERVPIVPGYQRRVDCTITTR
jgi:hypothetical protein